MPEQMITSWTAPGVLSVIFTLICQSAQALSVHLLFVIFIWFLYFAWGILFKFKYKVVRSVRRFGALCALCWSGSNLFTVACAGDTWAHICKSFSDFITLRMAKWKFLAQSYQKAGRMCGLDLYIDVLHMSTCAQLQDTQHTLNWP